MSSRLTCAGLAGEDISGSGATPQGSGGGGDVTGEGRTASIHPAYPCPP
jgi:hypothetical protein